MNERATDHEAARARVVHAARLWRECDTSQSADRGMECGCLDRLADAVDALVDILETGEDRDERMHAFYRRIAAKLSAGDFVAVDDEIALIDVEKMGTAPLLAWLTVTLAARDSLTMRKRLALAVRVKLQRDDPDRVNALLAGLE